MAQKAVLKTLSEGDVTRWFFFQLVANVVIALLSWPQSSVLRLGSEEWAERRELRRTFGLHGLLLLASFVVVTALVLGGHGAIDAYVKLPGAAGLVLAYAFASGAGLVVGAHLKPAQRVARFALLPLVTRTFWATTLVTLVFGLHHELGAVDVVWVCFVTAIPQLVLGLGFVARAVLPPSWPRPGDAARALAFGIPVVARGLGLQALAYVNLMLIAPRLGDVQAARFQVPATLPEQAALFATALEDLMGPILARAAHQGEVGVQRAYYRTLAPQVVLGWAAAAGAALLLARPVLLALSAKAVDESAPALEVLLLATAVRVIVSLETPVLDAHLIGTPALVFYALGFAINVGLTLALIPVFGVEGAAWGSFLGWLANAVARSVYTQARFQVSALRLYVFLWPVAVAFAWARLGPQALAALLPWRSARDAVAATVLLLLTLVIGKVSGTFAPQTLPLLEQVRMPAVLRRALARFYGVALEPRGES